METTYIVYKIECRANGKVYIGKTCRTMRQRWKAHCSNSSGCWALRNAIKKHGEKAFVMTLVASGLTNEQACSVEKSKIAEEGCMTPFGYNIRDGGEGVGANHPTQGAAIAAAWQRQDTRDRHMAWRTHERMVQQANSDGQWYEQQMSWMNKRMKEAKEMEVMDAIQMLSYRTKKNKQHGTRKGWSTDRMLWVDRMLQSQIETVCLASGVPVPPASSYEQTTHAYEMILAGSRGWTFRGGQRVRKTLRTRSPPSAGTSAEHASEQGDQDSDGVPSDCDDLLMYIPAASRRSRLQEATKGTST